jgi:hypothetical protein
MAVQTDKFLNTVRGKALVGHASPEEILKVFEHIDALEMFLDEHDEDDVFGTEGWRHAIGLD